MVNVHFSLLPRWRGAAPVERALLAGDDVTGVCIMDVEEGLDTGRRLRLPGGADRPDDDGRRAARASSSTLGTELLVDVLAAAAAGTRSRRSGDVDVRREDHARRAAARLGPPGRRARPLGPRRRGVDDVPRPPPEGPPGGGRRRRRRAGRRSAPTATVGTGDGSLRLVTVQPEGKAPMSWADFANGARPRPGERLGDVASARCPTPCAPRC